MNVNNLSIANPQGNSCNDDTYWYCIRQYREVVYCKKLEEQNNAVDKFEKRRLKLKRLIREQCEGINAKLARRIKREPSYINRLLYPEGKPGKRNIGDEIMDAVIDEFNLPESFWTDPEPVEFLSKKDLLRQKMKDLIDMIDDENQLIQGVGFLDYVVRRAEPIEYEPIKKEEKETKK